MLYISRADAVAAFAASDDDVDESHIFQGDIFHSVTFVAPGHDDTVLAPGIVLSHDCEYTKARRRPTEYPLIVAPLRELAAFPKDQAELIRSNRLRYLLHLPIEGPVETEQAADLRLMQPVLAAELQQYQYLTSASETLKRRIRAKVVEFITRELTLDEG